VLGVTHIELFVSNIWQQLQQRADIDEWNIRNLKSQDFIIKCNILGNSDLFDQLFAHLFMKFRSEQFINFIMWPVYR
jgi:hypothetical protein